MPAKVEIAEGLTEFGVRVLPLTPGKNHKYLPACAELGDLRHHPAWVSGCGGDTLIVVWP